jgi:hypothetical protein
MIPRGKIVKPIPHNGLRLVGSDPAHPLPIGTCRTPPDLAEVARLWGDLPGPIRAAILALARSGSGSAGSGHGPA